MKRLGEKVLGWFIVQEPGDDDSPSEATANASTSTPGGKAEGSGGRPHPTTPAPALPADAVCAGERRSFAHVYREAGLPEVDHERLNKVVDLIGSLPADAAPEMKRTIVAAALQAFGVPIDRICHTANACLTVLDTHVHDGREQTTDVVAHANARIAKLTAEIEDVKRSITAQEAAQTSLVQSTQLEKSRLTTVLTFFGRTADRERTTPIPTGARERRAS